MSILDCIRLDKSTTCNMQVRFFSHYSLLIILSRIHLHSLTILRLLCNASTAHREVLCILGTGFGYVYDAFGMWTQLASQVQCEWEIFTL